MRHAAHWVLFVLEGGRYALPLSVVERVIAAALVTPLPGAPAVISGALNIAGAVLPVFDLRARFGLRQRALRPSDQFIIAQAAARRVVLVIDAATGLIEGSAQDVTDTDLITQGMPHIRGVIARTDGLVLIHDLDAFLSEAEARTLDDVLDRELRHAS
jgi:purine-binding chemotaxis protein CheW